MDGLKTYQTLRSCFFDFFFFCEYVLQYARLPLGVCVWGGGEPDVLQGGEMAGAGEG